MEKIREAKSGYNIAINLFLLSLVMIGQIEELNFALNAVHTQA